MDIKITGRNLDLDDSLKHYVTKKVRKLERIYKRIYKCDVVLGEEKNIKTAEIIVSLKRNKLVAKENALDIYASIDIVSDKIKKRLRRLNDRINSQKRRGMWGKVFQRETWIGSTQEDI
ncbi:MAG: ribosome-associated translation inhibitor RaiA [Candidatus Omnitrophota bacterium]